VDFLSSLNIREFNYGGCSGPNQWIKSANQGLIEATNPASNEKFASINTCNGKDYEEIIMASVKAQHHWQKIPAPRRGDLVRRIGELLRKNQDALGSLVCVEMGKIKQEGDGEVQEMIDIADLAVGQSRMLYGKTMHSERANHRMYEQWHPLGVVGVISAFNFPIAVWAWNALIAAVAGNTVIWKPSKKTALCAIAIQHICNTVMLEAGLTGIFSIFVPNENQLASRFVDDHRIKLISFTGSSQVGGQIAQTVSARMGKTLLECSGNNAIIVDETADLDLAIPAIVFGAIGTAGQRCTSTRRLFIHNEIYDNLVEQLINAYQQIKIGNPLKEGTLMGPLIDDKAVKTYLAAINEATRQGGRVRYGGEVIKQKGHFVSPALIEMREQTEIVKQETFGPILYLLRFSDLDTAIEQQNDVPQGLSSAIFTQNLNHSERFLSVAGSDCGIANVNIGTSGAEIGGAFGGEKQTGGGREAGSDCWKAYMRRQTNTINWGNELPLAQGIKFDLESKGAKR